MRVDSSSRDFAVRLRWLLLAGAATLMAACSTIKLGYNNAERLLMYSLGDYVALSSEQEQVLRERVNAVHHWHRATQLPDYAAFIRQAQAQIDDHVTAEEVLQFNDGLNARLSAVGERIAPDFAHLALSLTPAQIEQLEKKMNKDTRKARREFSRDGAADPIEQRTKKYAERAEFWFGKLSADQMLAVRESLAAQPMSTSYWIDERERRQRELLALLRKIHLERPSEEVATKWIRQYLRALSEPADAQRRARAEAYRRHRAELIAELINRATPQQRAQLSRRLSNYADEFTGLAGRASPRQAERRAEAS